MRHTTDFMVLYFGCHDMISLDCSVCAPLLGLGSHVGQARSHEDFTRAGLEDRPRSNEQPEENNGDREDL